MIDRTNAYNRFSAPPERARIILVDESGSVAHNPKVWQHVKDAVVNTAADAARRGKPVSVIGTSDNAVVHKGPNDPFPAPVLDLLMDREAGCGATYLRKGLEAAVKVALQTPVAGNQDILYIGDGVTDPSDVAGTRVLAEQAKSSGINFTGILFGPDGHESSEAFEPGTCYLVPDPAQLKAAIASLHNDSRPQTESLAQKGLTSMQSAIRRSDFNGTSGELFLRAIATHGDNQERQVAAVANQAASVSRTDLAKFCVRFLALQGLANGVHGPIGAVLAEFGQAIAEKDESGSEAALSTVMRAIADKSQHDGEQAVAQAVGKLHYPECPDGQVGYKSGFNYIAAGELPQLAHHALAEFGLGVSQTSPQERLSARSQNIVGLLVNKVVLESIRDLPAGDKTQASIMQAAIDVAHKQVRDKSIDGAVAVHREAFHSVLGG